MAQQLFSFDNTYGYTQEEMDILNAEFAERFRNGDFTYSNGKRMDKETAMKYFTDQVASR